MRTARCGPDKNPPAQGSKHLITITLAATLKSWREKNILPGYEILKMKTTKMRQYTWSSQVYVY